jgi:hypothetical protein
MLQSVGFHFEDLTGSVTGLDCDLGLDGGGTSIDGVGGGFRNIRGGYGLCFGDCR